MTASDSLQLQGLRENLAEFVRTGDWGRLRASLEGLHPSDVADLVAALDEESSRLAVMRALPAELASETLAEMERFEERGDLLAALAPERGAELLHELADDDAVDLISELEPADRDRILAALPIQEAGDLQGLLLYGDETAGGLMTTGLVSVRASRTAADAIGEVRRQGREVEDFYTIFVVDERNRLLGSVPLDDLILAEPGTVVEDLVEPVPVTVRPDLDQEEVGRILSRYNMVSVPVVNSTGVLLGRVTFDDVLDVIEAERTEDILRLAGVPDEEELRAPWTDAVRSRLPWLFLNLVTAAAAASVVFFFTDTIEAVSILAAIMPVIAGMGGNSATQALAVTVRRIAISDEPVDARYEMVGKEILVGVVNGIALGVVAAVAATMIALALGGAPILGVVVLFAMWGNIIVAGFAGAFIPVLLDRMGIDPAVASSVFVTTLTDLFGFFLLLGLGSWLLL